MKFDTKIWIGSSTEINTAVQERAFKYGYAWEEFGQKPSHLRCNWMLLSAKDKTIIPFYNQTYGDFLRNPSKETSVLEFINSRRRYTKHDKSNR